MHKKSSKSDKKKLVIKKRYLVVTDIYFLLLDPIKDQKNFGRLVLVGDVQDFNTCEETNMVGNKMTLKWKHSINNNVVYSIKLKLRNLLSYASNSKRTNYKTS